MLRPPVVLVVLDGWGVRENREGNAIAQAQLATMENFYSRYSWTSLEASGGRVGLPPCQMGNSEVGHLSIGSGRVVLQDLTRINQAIKTDQFFSFASQRPFMDVARQSSLHLIGLVSDGGVHSHIQHLLALLRMSRQQNVKNVYIHAITDGRDTRTKGGVEFFKQLQSETEKLGTGQLSSVCGRYYAMDRDSRWDRIEKAYRVIVEGRGDQAFRDPILGLQDAYRSGVSDEFVIPFAVVDSVGRPIGSLAECHAAIFFNFRADRARQLTRSLTGVDFHNFERHQNPIEHFLTMTEYDSTSDLPAIFPPKSLQNTLAKVLTNHNIRNLRVAETEKYAHVTYFFNGGEEEPSGNEQRILVPSPRVATYDLRPQMSAHEITDRLIRELDRKLFQAVVVNFANADMVGHTGDLNATIRAVETVDSCLGRIHEKIQNLGGIMMVTADHGNAELMIDSKTGDPHTAHTSQPVPFILADAHYRHTLRRGGSLEDVAPTLLDYLGVEKPEEMTGRSLLQ